MSGLLFLEGKRYTHEDLAAGKFEVASALAQKVLTFCRAWLTGQTHFVLATSGSTGNPKKIEVSRLAMQHSAQLTRQALGLQAGNQALVCLDTQFVAGQMMLVRGMEIGLTLHVVEASANPFARLPPDLIIDFVALVPYQLETILNSSASARLHSMATAIIGGAPVAPGTIEKLQPYPCRFFATYGMTETLSHIALRPLNSQHASPYFRALPTVCLATDGRGCLVITAPFLPSPVVTNDVVRIIGTDEFEWLGRWDFVINSGGIKIHPERLEEKLDPIFRRAGAPHRFFICGQPHPQFHQQVTLVVESLDAAQLVPIWKEIRIALGKYEVPRQIWSVPHFLSTPSGKVDRVATLKSNPQPLPIPEEV